MLRAGYAYCSTNGFVGGATGVLLAWPAWAFLGTVFGTAALVVIGLICVLFLARFDVVQLLDTLRERHQERSQLRAQQRAEEEQRLQQEEQQRIAEENERRLITPAYTRRGRQQPAPEPPPAPQQPVYAGYGEGMPVMQPYGAYPQQQPAQQQVQQPVQQQPEMYDELIMPTETVPFWKRGKNKKENKQQPTTAYQPPKPTPPGEEGISPAEKQETLLLSSSKRKAQQRLEAIRSRQEEIDKRLEGNERARESTRPWMMYFAPACQQTQQTPPSPEETQPVEQAEPLPVEDKQSAYRRPAETPAPEPVQEHSQKPETPYIYPPIDLLNLPAKKETQDNRAQDTQRAAKLEKTLESFGIPAKVQRVTHGPAVTRFELGLTSGGINVKRVLSIADNIALDMAANGSVRIEIPIPGTNLFGVEIPNVEVQSVTLGEVLSSNEMYAAQSPLAVALGRDVSGNPVICDLEKMPHLLIAGQTGSGKSVCINAIINSLLYRSSPEEVRMIMIDPKVVELHCYNVVPHLLVPVVSDPHKAAGALAWAVAEMLRRYNLIQTKKVRNITEYNKKLEPGEQKMPRIIIIIDELADLMIACKKEVEASIIRIAQLSRAAGIHLIVATQRPTVDVITGLIKSNIPSRIAFAVASSLDSRTILDQNGAEKLMGRGDMIYSPTGSNRPTRVQGCYLNDEEMERVVEYIAKHSKAEFDQDVIEALEKEDNLDNALLKAGEDGEGEGLDERLEEAIDIVITDGQASISMLQRRMKIGYARAGRLIDDMAARGIISKSTGSKPREVLMSREEYENNKETLLK